MLSKYKADNGAIHFIQIRPETLTLNLAGNFNSAPGGLATTPVYARGTSSRYGYGVNARRVRFQFTAPPSGYANGGVISLPWLDAATWAAVKGTTAGAYQGAPIAVLGFEEEYVH